MAIDEVCNGNPPTACSAKHVRVLMRTGIITVVPADNVTTEGFCATADALLVGRFRPVLDNEWAFRPEAERTVRLTMNGTAAFPGQGMGLRIAERRIVGGESACHLVLHKVSPQTASTTPPTQVTSPPGLSTSTPERASTTATATTFSTAGSTTASSAGVTTTALSSSSSQAVATTTVSAVGTTNAPAEARQSTAAAAAAGGAVGAVAVIALILFLVPRRMAKSKHARRMDALAPPTPPHLIAAVCFEPRCRLLVAEDVLRCLWTCRAGHCK